MMIIDPYTFQRLTVTKLSKVSNDTVAVRCDKPSGYTYRAGQYAIVRVVTDKEARLIRQYSFSSAPADDFIELLVQHEKDGAVSTWFNAAAHVGDVIELSEAFGGFVLQKPIENILFIAGRVGVAPLLSMIKTLPSSASFDLLYSVSTKGQICEPELLQKYQTSLFVTSDGQRIDEKALKPYLKNTQVTYLCGSKRFVDGVYGYLQALGVSPENICRELFTLE